MAAATSDVVDQGSGATGRWWAWVALAVFFIGVNAADALLALHELEMQQGSVFLLRFVSLFLTWQWLEAECQPYGQTYPLDIGMFLYAVGAFLIPYYMWRNQRWRGILKLAGLLAMWGASYILSQGAFYVLSQTTQE